jgi:eukaryotic-like serine/threonine-protein kinase
LSEPVSPQSDTELRSLVERALSAHYELDSEIGRGGMGVVYRAKDRRLKRTVAIKILPPELAFRSEIKTRFLREAEMAAQLNHPNIVDIYAVDEAGGIVFFVMAYITGDNVAKLLHDHGALSIDQTRRILRDVADALAYAHERGVIHRDIKPDNILIDADSGRPMVTDFGIARAVSEGETRLTATGIAIGTPTYMSPEQAAGERAIDGRSDLYSLGILGYQMLSGEPPFVANSTPAILVKHVSERPVPIEQRRSDVPPDLARVIMQLLEKDPANRFPSAGSVVVALDTGRMPAFASSGNMVVTNAAPASSAPTVPQQAGYPAGAQQSGFAQQAPTAEEYRRWEAPEVVRFRKKVAPYLFINGVLVVLDVTAGVDVLWIPVIWTIFMAFRYSRLWSDGYDWRDVFRQPRDRDLIDVAEDAITYTRSMFNRDKRRALREERRNRIARPANYAQGGGGAPQLPPLAMDDVARAAGTFGDRIHRAERDRNEILALLERMPSSERQRIPDVGRSATALAERVRNLALALADIDRSAAAGGSEALEAEISRLENAANPLDQSGSDERVRRLAFLKRQRRAIAEVSAKRGSIAAKLETCVVALQNIKLDLIRLNAGSQTPQHITSLAMDALNLADSVDTALYVADEMRTTGSKQARPSAAR